MTVDERRRIRELGFRKIIKARKLATKTGSIISTTKNYFQATDCIEIIDWNANALTPSPLLRRVSYDNVCAKIPADKTADK